MIPQWTNEVQTKSGLLQEIGAGSQIMDEDFRSMQKEALYKRELHD